MVTETYKPAEKAIVQGVNDFLVFGTAAVSSLLAGVVQTSLGWRAVNLSSIPFLGVAVLALLWYIFRNAEKEVISLVKQDSTA